MRTSKFFCLLYAFIGIPAEALLADTTPQEAFDGSFRLQTGEVITGGYFVENAQGRFLYMDTEGLSKGGLFERISDSVLRSVIPPGAVDIEFLFELDNKVTALVWKERGKDPLRGERIFPHQSRPIRFTSEDGTQLQGRLLLPLCQGPHPAVIAVHGSGPVNRYGGPYNTFFLKHGVAVIAYDKRGFTTARGDWQEPDLAKLSADAAAAIRFAATVPELDSRRLGFFGSSQAGWVVPRAAVEAKETAFMILRAGAAMSHWETNLHEIRQELRGEGLDGLGLDNAVALRHEIYELAMQGKPISATDDLVTPYLNKTWYRTAFGEGLISVRWSARSWEWMQRNYKVSPTTHLQQFKGPVLWFLAELDENVPLVPTRAALERAFKVASGVDHEIVVLSGALHSFLIPGSSGRPPRFSDGFFNRLGTWMHEHSFADSACWTSK